MILGLSSSCFIREAYNGTVIIQIQSIEITDTTVYPGGMPLWFGLVAFLFVSNVNS